MDIAPVEGEIPRAAVGAQVDERVLLGAGGRADLDAHEAVIVGLRIRADGVAIPRPQELRHQAGLGGGDAGAGRGQARERRGLDIDPPGAGLGGQGERPGVRRARRQGDRIARLRAVERRLEISAGWDIDMVSRRGRIGRVDEGLGQRRQDLTNRACADRHRPHSPP